jgi:hypothetical protein
MVKRSLARFGSQPPAPERKGPVTVSVHRNRSLSDAGQRSPKSKRDYVITYHVRDKCIVPDALWCVCWWFFSELR